MSSASGTIGSQEPAISKSYDNMLSHGGDTRHAKTSCTHSLRKLPHPPLRHHRIVPPIHLAHLPQLRLRHGAANHGEVSGERDSVVVPERELFASLVFEVEDELGVFTVLVGQDVFPLEDRRVKAAAAEGREALFEDAFNVFATVHFAWAIISCSLHR